MAVSYVFNKKEFFAVTSLLGITAKKLDEFCTATENSDDDIKAILSMQEKNFLKLKSNNSITISPVFVYLLKEMETAEKYLDFFNDRCIVYCCDGLYIMLREDTNNMNNTIITPVETLKELEEIFEENNLCEYREERIFDKGDLIF